MTDASDQTWWSAAEIAAAGLPDLPGTARAVQIMAKREGWANHPGKTRRRAGRGGGMEYHFSLFPTRAKVALARRRQTTASPRPSRDRDTLWADYDRKSDKAKRRSQDRLAALAEVEALELAGLTRSAAVDEVRRSRKVSEKSVWNWLSLVAGVPREDWLPHLAPRSGGGATDKVVVPEVFLEFVKSAWLTQSGPDMTAAYEWAERDAKSRGEPVPPLWKVRRVIAETVPKHIEVFKREGVMGLRRYFPHQTRSKTSMHAMEAVQGDYHKFDVFVLWPGMEAPVRVQMIAFSDIYSGKILAYRLSLTANSNTVQLCFGDLVRKYGIPYHALLDNGREFAAKVMTGGAKTRFRFKIQDDDIPGLLHLLGITVHWAQPAWGQAKPIERAFKDLCGRVAKHPAFVGAYTGNSPTAKPENYQDRAVTLSEFRQVLDQEIAAHNARRGRRSETANKRSFDEVFNDSYRQAPIRKATEEQQVLWLLTAKGVRASSKNGELSLYDNRYWSEWMYSIAGKKVVARFDPDNLHEAIRVYDLDGRYLGGAAVVQKGDFLNVDDARAHQRARNALVKATRAEAKAHKTLTDAAIAARLRAAGQSVPEGPLPEAEVVRLAVPHSKAPKGQGRSTRHVDIDAEQRLEAKIHQLKTRHQAQTEDDPEARFARAQELEVLQAEGHPMTEEQTAWLADYQTTGEYRAHARMNRALGDKDN
ncbi:transposase domain-containing protein [Sagittula salina]|uniref:Mu transposase C-terminal domain-containing protein n=1 Tax=Sagittula salina TaxID=2820268 RepID=A0A940MRC1_9RHOB|nr:transposase domain-containing protein [Sagittula salina]MBP0483969.1 Mu transposase C-terminal domain-containing protein [Sagittula salina]